MTASNPCLDAPSRRDTFERVVLIDPTHIPKTTPPEAEARAVVEAEGLRVMVGGVRVADRVIEGARWLEVTLRVWRPRERKP